ncbi:hypothetical protein [Caniella muris]|uniref:hypothetical protein n=1 Tax=Caniella muris TaxID=2941502 RepID=UPI00203C02AB|nr:hypothetical protein [Caniella muris]
MDLTGTEGVATKAARGPVGRARRALSVLFDPHSRMERFIVECAVAAAAMAVVLCASFWFWLDSMRVDLAETAVYTETFAMASSGATGKVASCGSTSDGLHTFLLVRFDSPGQVSLNPDRWRIVVNRSPMAGNPEEALCLPEGRITFYSDSGWALVTMDSLDGTPFPDMVLSVSLQSKAQISGGTGQVQEAVEAAEVTDADREAGFEDADRADMDVNPMAAEAVDADRYLAGGSIDPDLVWRGEVVPETEGTLRKTAQDALTALAQARARITEYDERARQVGVGHTGGALLATLLEDRVDAEAMTFSRTDDAAGADVDLSADPLSEGGSYAATAKTQGSAGELLAARAAKAKEASATDGFKDVSWTLDGAPYDTSALSRTQAQKVEQARLDLEQAWANYQGLRKSYIDALDKLLELEEDADGARDYKVTASGDQLWVG